MARSDLSWGRDLEDIAAGLEENGLEAAGDFATAALEVVQHRACNASGICDSVDAAQVTLFWLHLIFLTIGTASNSSLSITSINAA